MTIYVNGEPYVPTWKYTELVSDSQIPPTVGTWYTVLDVGNCFLVYFIGKLNCSDASSHLEVKITIDDVEYTLNKLQSDVTNYFYSLGLDSDVLTAGTTEVMAGYFFPIYAQSLKIEYRTSDADVSAIYAYLRYYSI